MFGFGNKLSDEKNVRKCFRPNENIVRTFPIMYKLDKCAKNCNSIYFTTSEPYENA